MAVRLHLLSLLRVAGLFRWSALRKTTTSGGETTSDKAEILLRGWEATDLQVEEGLKTVSLLYKRGL